MKKKGTPKTGGRAAGTPNKTTTDIRQFVDALIGKNLPKMEQDLNCLEPKDRLLILEKMMSYTIPRLQSISVEAQIAAQIQAEYDGLERLLNNAPDEAINEIVERLMRLNKLNKQENE